MARLFLRTTVFFLVLGASFPLTSGAQTPQVPPVSPESLAFREFTRRAEQYVKLQKTMPRLRATKDRKEIVERRNALAQRIQETRSKAQPGDMFTPDITEELRSVIRSTFQGATAPAVRKTIRQGEPLQGWQLTVNGIYPEHVPLTTVPPTLLLRLPRLPSEVAYRIIGHDLVLEDPEARLVLDFIRAIIP